MAFQTPPLPFTRSSRGGCSVRMSASPPARLRALLAERRLHLMPCCHDALSAKLIERAGFSLTFMSGFSTAASKGLPDTGLLSYGEMVANLASITPHVDIPVLADGDTGFGNALNVRRTVLGYAAAGAAGVLIEDQVNPKRCGHTKGKAVVERAEALRRVKAAVDASREGGGIVVVARTDAARFDFEEALTRAKLFHELGADMTFVEAPKSEKEMQRFCDEVPGAKLVNMLEQGDTPILSPDRLKEIGFSIAAYPLTLLNASIRAQEIVLQKLKEGKPEEVQEWLKSFDQLKDVVGFNDYYEREQRYMD